MRAYRDELDYLQDEARADLNAELEAWPRCDSGHILHPDATECGTCGMIFDAWLSGLTPKQLDTLASIYEPVADGEPF